MSRVLKSIALSLVYVMVLLGIYLLHVYYFNVSVIFYSALVDATIAAAIVGLLLFLLPKRFGLDWFNKVLLIVIWLLGGYAFAISVPTVVDRSLSMYILEKLDQRGGGIEQDRFEDVFVSEYMHEYRLVDVRLTEQVQSGTVEIVDGCVRLTDWGHQIAAVTRFLRTHFLAKNRLLNDEFTADLTDPLESSPTGNPDYVC